MRSGSGSRPSRLRVNLNAGFSARAVSFFLGVGLCMGLTATGAELTSPTRVKHINASLGGASSPGQGVVMGSYSYFAAFRTGEGTELWRSDGTTVELVKDIYPGTASSSPANLTVVGTKLYFTATDIAGTELWVTEGTEATTALMDVRPGTDSSTPLNLTAVGSRLYFTATTTSLGIELHYAEGATATYVGTEVRVGTTNPSFGNLRAVGSKVVFTAGDGVNGTELWASDGSTTAMIKNITAGSANTTFGTLFVVGDVGDGTKVYFSANNGAVNGAELWASGGAFDGSDTTMLTPEIGSGATGSTPLNLTLVGSRLYFTATTATLGIELHYVLGSTINYVGTEVRVGTLSPLFNNLRAVGSKVVFTANDNVNGTELWASDGSTTAIIKNITAGATGTTFGSLFVVGDVGDGTKVYFSANNGAAANGAELWASGGAFDGSDTTMLTPEVGPTTTSSSPLNLTLAGSRLYFTALTETLGIELHYVSGSTINYVGTEVRSGTTTPSFANFTALGSKVLFSATDGSGAELWVSSAGGAPSCLDIEPASGARAITAAAQYAVQELGGIYYFAASEGVNGTELWLSDGTDAGTKLQKDINTTAGASSSPQYLTIFKNNLVFQASDGSDTELWQSTGAEGDGTEIDFNVGAALSSTPQWFYVHANGTEAVTDDLLFFGGVEGTFGTELGKFDGTTAARVSNFNNVLNGSGLGSAAAYMTACPANQDLVLQCRRYEGTTDYGNEVGVYTSGGATTAYNTRNKATNPQSTSPSYMTAFAGKVFFSGYAFTSTYFGDPAKYAADTDYGSELWIYDASGPRLFKDIATGSSSPLNLTVLGSQMLFTAATGFLGTDRELWVTDGTFDGTVLLKDINTTGASASSSPDTFFVDGTTAYFVANDGSTGRELWKTDGTAVGTVLVKDINTGAGSSSPTDFASIDGVVYFCANGTTGGRELWKTDGSAGGTVRAFGGTDINPGAGSAYITGMKRLGSSPTVLFLAQDGNGLELWKATIGAAGATPEIVLLDPNDTVIASSGTYSFGLVRRGSERLAQLTIRNDPGAGGALNLTGTPLVNKTGGDAVITVSSQPGVSSLDPGDETTFIVRFAPIGGASPTVSASATFSIESNDPETPLLFTVTGNGHVGTLIRLQ